MVGDHRGPGASGLELKVSIGALVLLLAVGLLAALVTVTSPEVRAAHVTFHLYGKATTGWGLSPGGETNPGPTLTVNLGDQVTLLLTDEDGGTTAGHAFWVDYDKNNVPDSNEPNSPVFTSTIYYNFTASVAGTAPYYCTVHSIPGSSSSPMRGTWITNAPPKPQIVSPGRGTDWTGGIPHAVVFNVTNDGPLTSVTVWVNYSYNGGASTGRIAGPLTPSSGSNTVSWTPGLLNATDVIVNVTAQDNLGARSSALTSAFTVDSSPPFVAGFSPPFDATNVPPNLVFLIGWSEAMNRSTVATPATLSVKQVSSGAYVAGAFRWASIGETLYFTPSAYLSPMTLYEVGVNTSAKDASSPGNSMAAPFVLRFTTGAAPDTTPPTIATPAVTQTSTDSSGGAVNLTVSVTDNVAVRDVLIGVGSPALGVNATYPMFPVRGSTFYFNHTFAAGTYSYTILAADSSGNVAYYNGTIQVKSTSSTPPTGPAPPAFDTLPSVAVTGVVAAAALVAALLLRRRKKPKAP